MCETAQDNETPHHQNTKQESRAVAGNYRAMRDTRAERLHLILGHRSE